MKKCQTCKSEKNEDQFCKEKRRPDGLCSQCKECLSKRKAIYRNKNPEHVKKVAAKSRVKHIAEIRKFNRLRMQELRKNEEFKLIEKEQKKRYWEANAIRLREKQNLEKQRPEKKEKLNAYMRIYRKTHFLEKVQARKILWEAIRVGFIKRPSKCEVCMKECKPDGHHKDYSKPLDVQWLCRTCHNHQHGKLLDVKI